ncbi:hypothetical protein KFK09_009459 [Dendrobium nobile]|uniref:Acid phosphatase/vanadium-dependent haloperoxidase-related protein n=1 Tax=Dendrobium nobile TaxID=94219 RepID=A0A8T3BJX4_DENNO|nr:hypothetical protein KFK09_009459 [Dendrobium nobile]
MAAAALRAFYQISIPIPYVQGPKTKPFVFHTSSHHLSLHIGTSPKPSSHKTLESRHDSPHLAPIYVILPFFNSFSVFVRSCLCGGVAVGDHYGGDYVCSGSVGALLMSTTAAAVSKARASPFLWTLAGNPTFVSGLLAWALAQTMKVALHFFVERKLDMGILFSCGGMPSSHSALCMALTASVAFWHGVGDSLFPVCLGFSLIVMYDAIGVRRHAGMQAEVLNKIVEDLFQAHPLSKRKLKELLGHTPSQVLAGALLAEFMCIR